MEANASGFENSLDADLRQLLNDILAQVIVHKAAHDVMAGRQRRCRDIQLRLCAGPYTFACIVTVWSTAGPLQGVKCRMLTSTKVLAGKASSRGFSRKSRTCPSSSPLPYFTSVQGILPHRDGH
jgi:hypothetical protein